MEDGKNGAMYRIVSCDEADQWEKRLLKNPLTSIRFQRGLDMGLKWMLLDNGIGDFGKMVLILAIPGIPEDWVLGKTPLKLAGSILLRVVA